MKRIIPQHTRVASTARLARFFTIALVPAALAAAVSVGVAAGIVNDFNDGNSTTLPDAYPGAAGEGWVDAWANAGSGTFFNCGVVSTLPLTIGGGPYVTWGLSNTTSECAIRRKYTNTFDLDLSLPYFIEFDLRCDSFTNTTGAKAWNSGNDNIVITARNGYYNNPGSDSTWWIKVAGDKQSGAPNSRSNLWSFFDGGEFSNSDSAGTFTNTPGFPFFIGTNFHFRIENRPYTKTYVVDISAVLNGVSSNLTTKELRWRSYSSVSDSARTNTTVLHFVTRRDVVADATVMSLDSLHVYQAPLDGVVPFITPVSPLQGAMQHAAASGLSFTVKTLGTTNWIPPGNISLVLNGVDVSASLVVTGPEGTRSATYSGLVDNMMYTAVVTASDQAGRSNTLTYKFDTLVPGAAEYLEAENYNFGTNAACNPNGSSTSADVQGCYLQNPLPSHYDNNSDTYINQAEGYVDRVGLSGVDFYDLWPAGGNLTSNRFRFCEPVGTVITTDPRRPANALYNVPEYALGFIQTGEWWNYTHEYTNSKYLVYMRAAGTSAQQFQLARVTSDRTQPNQTTSPLGTFNVPSTGSQNTFDYTPLTDGLGVPRLVGLNDITTLRLTATSISASSAGYPYVNLLLLVPQGSAGDPPWLTQVSPGAGSSNVPPQTDISITLQKGGAPIDPGSIVLKVNGQDVTASATSTITPTGATISYLPTTFFAMGSYNTVQVTYGDGNPQNLSSNQWSFHVGRYLPGTPIRVNFQTPTFTPTPAGYMPDIGMVFGDRGNGYNYGWDQDQQGQARDRGTAGSPPDDRYKTLNQFGTSSSSTRYWEIQLPNGTYSVHLVAGDGNAVDSTNYVAAEGTLIISNGIPNASKHWFEGTNNIVLADSRLTVYATNGFNVPNPGAGNSKICYLDIIPAGAPLDLTLHNPAASSSGFSFNIATISRALHVIEYKNQLTDPTWMPLTNVVGTGSSVAVVDPTGGQRFYRMRIP